MIDALGRVSLTLETLVLLLQPTDSNKLLLQWKDPSEVNRWLIGWTIR